MYGSSQDEYPTSNSSQSSQHSVTTSIVWPPYKSIMLIVRFLSLIMVGVYLSDIFSQLVVSRMIMFAWFGIAGADMIYAMREDEKFILTAVLSLVNGLLWAFIAGQIAH